MPRNAAESVCPPAVDPETMEFVIGDLSENLRSRREHEHGLSGPERFAPFPAQCRPLCDGLAGRDALCEDCRKKVVVRGARDCDPVATEPLHRSLDRFVHRGHCMTRVRVTHQRVPVEDQGRALDPVGDGDRAVGVLCHLEDGRPGGTETRPQDATRRDSDGRIMTPVRESPKGVVQVWTSACDVERVVVGALTMADIEVTRPRDGVTVLTMNRPAKLNAMTSGMVESLHEELSSVSKDRDCRVVILTGQGRGFCAGLDLGGYGSAPGFEWHGRVEQGLAVQRHIASLIPRLRSLPQPVIAAVNGPAAGGGFALVLGSDIRLAAASARFNAAFIRIGLSACDIGTSWLLPRLVGAARAQELMLTGRIFDAEEAGRIGLVTDVLPDDALMDAAFAKAHEIMANTPLGVALTKEGMWSALEIPGLQAAIDLENRQQIMASFSEDAAEARRARSEKREPRYRA